MKLKNPKKPKFKFFGDTLEAVSYVAAEMSATLQDDLARMEGPERKDYSADDRRDLKKRIADIETVTPLITAAPELLETLIGLHNALSRMIDKHDPDSVDAEWLSHSNEAIRNAGGV